MGSPAWVYRISGSRPTLPIRITLLTDAMSLSRSSGGEPLAGDLRRLRVGVAVHHVAVLDERLALAAEPLERHALLHPAVRELVARRVVLEERVPGLDGLLVHLLRVQALADPVLGIVGEVGVGVVPDVLREALDGEVVVAARVVGVGLAVELARGGDGGRRGGPGG